MSYDCQLQERATQPVMSIRSRTSVDKLPEVMGAVYGQLMGYLGEQGAYPAGAPFVAYYNMDMQDLDIEIGFPVAVPLPGRGEIEANEIPAGQAATCVHTGPYDQLGIAYDALMQWMQKQGYEGTGVAYEFYLNDPSETAPEELQTQIALPLK
jgi:effector-binding domain-containing protein